MFLDIECTTTQVLSNKQVVEYDRLLSSRSCRKQNNEQMGLPNRSVTLPSGHKIFCFCFVFMLCVDKATSIFAHFHSANNAGEEEEQSCGLAIYGSLGLLSLSLKQCRKNKMNTSILVDLFKDEWTHLD